MAKRFLTFYDIVTVNPKTNDYTTTNISNIQDNFDECDSITAKTHTIFHKKQYSKWTFFSFEIEQLKHWSVEWKSRVMAGS